MCPDVLQCLPSCVLVRVPGNFTGAHKTNLSGTHWSESFMSICNCIRPQPRRRYRECTGRPYSHDPFLSLSQKMTVKTARPQIGGSFVLLVISFPNDRLRLRPRRRTRCRDQTINPCAFPSVRRPLPYGTPPAAVRYRVVHSHTHTRRHRDKTIHRKPGTHKHARVRWPF